MCFRCDEKWRIGHLCKRRELSVLIVGEADNDGEVEDEFFDVEEEENVASLNNP